MGREQARPHWLWYPQTPDYSRRWYASRAFSTDKASHLSEVDELVSVDDLQEKIAEFEDYIQSTDVAAMQSKRAAFYCAKCGSNFIAQNCKLQRVDAVCNK